MIDPQAYRMRIGMFCIRMRRKSKSGKSDEFFQHDSLALGIALILTLLVIGGVEQNPGPDFIDGHLPGPSFSDVTLMDIMEAIRISQLQIDQLARQVNALMDAVTSTSYDNGRDALKNTITDKCNCVCDSSTSIPTQTTPCDPSSHVKPNIIATNETKTPIKASSPSPPINGDKSTTVIAQRRSRSPSTGTVSRVGAVLLGCQNVRRIASAARDEFLLGGQVVFKSIGGATVRDALGALQGAVAGCRAVSVDLVLHLGGNDLARQSVDYTLDCIAEVIKTAKQENKVRDIIICSVPQDPSTQLDYLTMKRSDLNYGIERLCWCEGIRFLDLRPRLNKCDYHGLDRSRLNLNRVGCRNAWQMLASEVTGFLD